MGTSFSFDCWYLARSFANRSLYGGSIPGGRHVIGFGIPLAAGCAVNPVAGREYDENLLMALTSVTFGDVGNPRHQYRFTVVARFLRLDLVTQFICPPWNIPDWSRFTVLVR